MAEQELALTGALRRGSVKKNVAAIHVSGKLTLLQRKLSNVLLLNAYDNLMTRPSHRIDARTLSMMIGYNSNDMETLKQALRSLAETVAEWDMLDDKGRQEWGVSALLSYARLRGGVCEYSYSPALAEKLHDPKVFALINLNIQKRFSSGHALALYENCYRFVRTGSTGWWPLDLFRRLMGVDGSTYYENYKHLNAKIIKPAVQEVNETSNIELTVDTRKEGRAVVALRFLIKENAPLQTFDAAVETDGVQGGQTFQRLTALGVSERLARQWIAEHGEEVVTDKLEYVANQQGVKSPVRYLSAALRDGFLGDEVTASPSPEILLAAQQRDTARREAEAVEAQRRRAIDVERRWRLDRIARVREIADARNPTQRDADRRLFLSRLEGELDRSDFARHGWSSALNAQAIIAFWEDLEPGIFDEVV
ncbi:replication initiation protein [Paracoccus sp. (in: a-proteobacteria)]|uniref:replication initiation protein n=1 Tax=Paracoccus sp. TaxID=267 RepID=UPI00289B6181|nr:replication initiation protein [Paracoccus sp. (in: a-proteobacteria)]